MSIAEADRRLTAPGARFEIGEIEIAGVRTRIWKNGPATLREIFQTARAYGERTFLVLGEDRVSYEAFARATLTLARRLSAEGVAKGDRVAIIMRNLPEWAAAFHAITLLGALATPLNAWWTGGELAFALNDSGAEIAIVDAERWERIVDARAPLKRVLVARGAGGVALESVLGPVSAWRDLPDVPYPDAAIGPEDSAAILYTSGTTGNPKGALATHRNLTNNVFAGAFAQARAALRRGAPAPAAPSIETPQRATLLAVPLFHVAGCTSNLGPLMMAGGKMVLMHRWEPEAAMALIEAERVNQTGGVPTIMWQLIEHPGRARFDLSSLDLILYGGAPSAPELVRRIKESFPRAQVGNAWGMTETSATFCSVVGEDYLNRPDSCGYPPPTGEIRIVGESGAAARAGEIGELWAKGPQVVRGYWNQPQASAETFVDGWVKTGDLARRDEEGFLIIADRSKDVLIRGGENIYCVEVENVLFAHPAVMDAALIAIAHRTLGEEPGAVVHLRPGASATEEELRAFVRARLAAFKVPVRVVFWPEMLPRNQSGKVLKRDLKDAFG